MKRYLWVLPLLIFACNSPEEQAADSVTEAEHFYAPEPGTVIASDSVAIEDELNEFYYSIFIKSTATSFNGTYLMNVAYGPNTAQSEIVYPELSGVITPAVRRGSALPDTYIIGFYMGDDNTFKDYAQVTARKVSADKREIELKYIKSYYVDSVAVTK